MLVPIIDPCVVQEWIKRYFVHDGLVYDGRVEAAATELLAHPELGRAWTIDRDGEAVGYLVLTYGFDHEAGGRLGVVTDFFLLESARGQGLGAAVLRELTEFAEREGLKQIELFVLKHNGRARQLYLRQGFQESADREHLFLQI